MAVNNALQKHTGAATGLLHYRVDDSRALHEDCWSWPHLKLSCDMGSDGLAAVCFLIYHLSLCLTLQQDHPHGCKNDLQQALRRTQLHPLACMMGIVFNISYGSWDTGTRWSEAKSAVEEWMQDPGVDGLFGEHVSEILRDRGLQDQEHEPGSFQVAAELLKAAPCWWKRGS